MVPGFRLKYVMRTENVRKAYALRGLPYPTISTEVEQSK